MPDQPDRTGSHARLVLLEPGSTLGSFRLLSLLGEGGMGRVFVAEDTRLGRKVALKVMMPHLAKEERARKMFLREARSAAAVGHDRIVTIHEAAEASGVPYIAMELLAGEPLNEFLSRTPCPPLSVALTIAYQVAEGLDAAHSHEQKLIHRDIKPANVWLRATPGRKGIDVRLLDFGLARASGGDTLSTGNAGKALGTPLYMAPEQWDGRGVDHQSDLYSLGVMLYQMVTGESPFQGDSVKELMFQICMPAVVPKSPTELNPAVPAEVSAFVLRMLAKAKAERVATAADVMRELEAYLHPGGVVARTKGWSGAQPLEAPAPHPEPRTGEGGNRPSGTPVLPHVAPGVALRSTPSYAQPPLRGEERVDPDTMPLLRETRWPAPVIRSEPQPSRGRTWLFVAGGVLLAAVVGAVVFLGGKPPTSETAKQTITPPPPTPIEPIPAPPPTRSAPPTRPAPVVPNAPPLLDCTVPGGASAGEVKRSQQDWVAYLGLPVEYPVDLGDGESMVFVLVPPGKFVMGTTEEELDALMKVFPKMDKKEHTDEMPQHAVTITKPMYVGRTEVTRGQFGRFTAADAKEGTKPAWAPDDTHPVANVSWHGSKAFAGWVGTRSLPAGFRTARLPREAEWEYACRAGTRSRYPNGSENSESLALIGNVCDASAKSANPTWDAIAANDRHVYTARAGFYAANHFGLFDMIGNVWEWCEDGYKADAYKTNVTSDLYIKPSEEASRVSRGGSYFKFPWHARPATRTGFHATMRDNVSGCRLILPQDSD